MSSAVARFVPVVGSIAIAGICFDFGRAIPFEQQWPLYEALRTTAAIVFGVVGIWMSILYPSALQKVFRRGGVFDADDQRSMELMISTVRISTLILVVVMIAGLTAKMLQQVTVLVPYFVWLRAGSFALLGGLTFLQFWTLLMTLAQTQLAHEDLQVEGKRKERLRAFNSQVQYDGSNKDRNK
jgi:hypothetical protein